MTIDADASLARPGGPPPRLRILLADDHQVVRRGLQLVLDGEVDLQVVAQAGHIESVRRQLQERQPDVLVPDLNRRLVGRLFADEIRTGSPD